MSHYKAEAEERLRLKGEFLKRIPEYQAELEPLLRDFPPESELWPDDEGVLERIIAFSDKWHVPITTPKYLAESPYSTGLPLEEGTYGVVNLTPGSTGMILVGIDPSLGKAAVVAGVKRVLDKSEASRKRFIKEATKVRDDIARVTPQVLREALVDWDLQEREGLTPVQIRDRVFPDSADPKTAAESGEHIDLEKSPEAALKSVKRRLELARRLIIGREYRHILPLTGGDALKRALDTLPILYRGEG